MSILRILFATVAGLLFEIEKLVRWRGLTLEFRRAYWKVRLRKLGDSAIIHPCVTIHSPERVSVGSGGSITEYVHIWGGGGVEIGDRVMIASHVAIASVSHRSDVARPRESSVSAPILIGNDCWVGAGAIILQGVTLGPGSIIGAGAVVTKDVMPGEIVVGSPARVLKEKPTTTDSRSVSQKLPLREAEE